VSYGHISSHTWYVVQSSDALQNFMF